MNEWQTGSPTNANRGNRKMNEWVDEWINEWINEWRTDWMKEGEMDEIALMVSREFKSGKIPDLCQWNNLSLTCSWFQTFNFKNLDRFFSFHLLLCHLPPLPHADTRASTASKISTNADPIRVTTAADAKISSTLTNAIAHLDITTVSVYRKKMNASPIPALTEAPASTECTSE